MLVVASAQAATPKSAAIASAHPLANAAGYEVLEAGGNAFDAAVAVSAALAVVEPNATGLGGGGFWLLHRAEDGFEVLVDGRERAPAAASANMFLDEQGDPVPGLSRNTALASGIPGQAAGLIHIAKTYGRLTLAQNLAPAIRLARQGFPMYPRLQSGLTFKQEQLLTNHAGKVFLPGGKVPEQGQIVTNPELADALELLARSGRDGFYTGEQARRIVEGVRGLGGIWTEADLADYQVVERVPLKTRYKDMVITGGPPPAGGLVVADALNILEPYQLDKVDSATRAHLVVEALRRAFRDRGQYLGDPDFVAVPIQRLVHPYYADGQRASIRLDKATPSDSLPGLSAWEATGTNTTHFSILDAEGNRVSASMSLNFWFGNGIMIPGTGVVLNNEMDDFSVKPGVADGFELVGADANVIAPGKRMLSSMAPTWAESDQGLVILGTPGGSRIISMVLLGVLAWSEGADAEHIVALPRFHHQYMPDVITYEDNTFSPDELEALKSLGHAFQLSGRRYGNMEVITWNYESGEVKAASDPRGDGEGRVY
ncbi:MAG: gamma-glutamyltransferase [Gammaproteobacteria bacterium]|nr:gamma-glutamyltransferase [Gammaproteobacteria bacterium]